MLRHLLLTIATITLVASTTQAHHDKDKFRRLTVNDGLSQNSVFEILQDRRGFIWVGTQDGLNRYDGYEFRVYKHNPDDENSLSQNTITALYEDRNGMLWVGTQKGGLDRFDPDVGLFEHFGHDDGDPRSLPGTMVMAIGEDAAGRVWVGTHSGLSRFDENTRDFDHYTHDPERFRSIGADVVTAILTDSRGAMWVGTWEGGLNRYVPDTDDFDVITYDPVNSAGLPDARVTALLEDHAGDLWVGTGKGLSHFHLDTETFEPARLSEDRSDSMYNGEITSILEDGSGALWVGTYSGGLLYRRSDETAFTQYLNDPDDDGSLSDNRVTTLIEDRSGVIWAGTSLGGINQVDRHRIRFAHLVHDPKDENSLSENTIWAIYEGRDKSVWIGTHSSGLVRYDRTTGRYTRFRPGDNGPNTVRGGHVRAIHEDAQGRVWLATQKGLELFQPGTGVVHVFKYTQGDNRGPSSPLISTILEDSKGQLWFGGIRGIDRFDETQKTFKPVFRGDWAEGVSDADNVLVLYEDSKRTLWAGTRLGLVHFDPETDRFERYVHDPADQTSISNNVVYAVYEDSDGGIWAGTFGGGLNRLDVETGSFRRWTEQNSALPTNTVFGVLGDENGLLWLSTHRGLARFNPVNETFRVFGIHHGVQSPEFNSGAFHKGKYTGDLYFGGINGVNIVRPGILRDNPNPPEVVLTDVHLQSKSLDTESDDRIITDLSPDRPLELGYDQNDLRIDYVGIHYSLPEGNQYAYMLENYDEHWRYVGTMREASYTNLDPGSYRFRVKAASSDGVWNDEGTSLEITIDPPWWQTTVAYVSYLALLVLGVFFVDTIQRKRLIKQERERSAVREAKLRAKALETQNERQARELEEARELQLSMLPRQVPEHPTVEIDAYMKTATEVGGDYYDFYVTPDGTLTVAIGDATDHGARAGTMVTAVKSIFNILVEEDDLRQVILRATRALKRMHLAMLYMAFGLVKVRGNRMRLAGAGMPAAMIFRSSTGEVEEVPLSGMPLGSLVDYPYEVTEIELHPGDTVLLMSDGFAERFNPGGEMFGYERCRRVFLDAARKRPEEIIDHLVRASDRWAENHSPTDDMTFVVMKTKSDIPSSPDGSTA